MTSELAVTSNGVSGVSGLSLSNPLMGYMSDVSMFDGFASDYMSSPFGIMGMLANTRQFDAMVGQAGEDFHRYDTVNILQEDIITLKPMVEALHQYRDPIWGKRLPIEQDRVGKLLDIDNDKAGDHKVAALYTLYCARYGGLKDENGPITLSNLNDPGLLIDQSKNLFAFTATQSRSKEIEKLAEVAVKAHNYELAAVLLKEMADGVGVDDKTVRTILVDSKNHMDEATHKRFITEVDTAHQKLTGKTLDDYIHTNYSNGGWIKLKWLGANDKGMEYIAALDTANQTTHHVSNPAALLEMSGIC